MVGRGEYSEIPQALIDTNGLEMFYQGSWQDYQEPLQDPNDKIYAVNADRLGGVGPALSFGRTMLEFGIQPVGLLLCAKGGTGIQAWSRDGLLYRTMLERVKLATSDHNLAGVLIYLGEGDTKTIETASNWLSAFKSLIYSIRKDTNKPNLPIVFAQLATISDQRRAQREHGFSAWDYLKEIQYNLRADNVAMIKTDDLSLKKDGLHLDMKSNVIVGKRFAEAMHKLLLNNAN